MFAPRSEQHSNDVALGWCVCHMCVEGCKRRRSACSKHLVNARLPTRSDIWKRREVCLSMSLMTAWACDAFERTIDCCSERTSGCGERFAMAGAWSTGA